MGGQPSSNLRAAIPLVTSHRLRQRPPGRLLREWNRLRAFMPLLSGGGDHDRLLVALAHEMKLDLPIPVTVTQPGIEAPFSPHRPVGGRDAVSAAGRSSYQVKTIAFGEWDNIVVHPGEQMTVRWTSTHAMERPIRRRTSRRRSLGLYRYRDADRVDGYLRSGHGPIGSQVAVDGRRSAAGCAPETVGLRDPATS